MTPVDRDFPDLKQQAHVWFVEPDTVADDETLAYCASLLDEQETARLARFHGEADRHVYLVSHAMLRSVLSLHGPLPPEQWRFSPGEHGRPEIIPEQYPGLRFNLSHTPGLAACVVTRERDCGIDVERLRRRGNPEGVARRMFSPPEILELRQRKGDAFKDYFYEHWVLREAWVKARGIGISFPTRLIHFKTGDTGVSADFDASLGVEAKEWQFELFRPTGEHVAAVALQRPRDERYEIRIRRFSFDSSR